MCHKKGLKIPLCITSKMKTKTHLKTFRFIFQRFQKHFSCKCQAQNMKQGDANFDF